MQGDRTMLDTQNPQPTDPPENTGGGTSPVSPESPNDPQATDPPENTGGGTTPIPE